MRVFSGILTWISLFVCVLVCAVNSANKKCTYQRNVFGFFLFVPRWNRVFLRLQRVVFVVIVDRARNSEISRHKNRMCYDKNASTKKCWVEFKSFSLHGKVCCMGNGCTVWTAMNIGTSTFWTWYRVISNHFLSIKPQLAVEQVYHAVAVDMVPVDLISFFFPSHFGLITKQIDILSVYSEHIHFHIFKNTLI